MDRDERNSGTGTPFALGNLRTKPPSVVLVAVLMSVVAGAFAGWSTLALSAEFYRLSIGAWAFLVVGVGSLAYYSYLGTKAEIVGVGCYLLAIEVLARPVILFGGRLVGARRGTVGGAQTLLGGVVGLLLWGTIAVLLAGLLVVVGNYVRNRAERTSLHRAKRAMRDQM